MLSWGSGASEMMDEVDELASLLPSSLTGRPAEDEPPAALSCCSRLTWKQRLVAFGIFFTMGTVCSLLSSTFVPFMMVRPARFAVPYSLGNICSICSTMFLLGPVSQMRKMFHEDRRAATLVYFATMVGTVVAAVVTGRVLPVLLLTAAQTAAMLWYSLSYVPGARGLVRQFVWAFVCE